MAWGFARSTWSKAGNRKTGTKGLRERARRELERRVSRRASSFYLVRLASVFYSLFPALIKPPAHFSRNQVRGEAGTIGDRPHPPPGPNWQRWTQSGEDRPHQPKTIILPVEEALLRVENSRVGQLDVRNP